MEQENHNEDDSIAVYDKQFSPEIWDNLECKSEDYTSVIHIKKSFHQEIKKNRKQVKSNKRNPAKGSQYFSNLKLYKNDYSHLFDDWRDDHAYQTAIPNTVIFIFVFLIK